MNCTVLAWLPGTHQFVVQVGDEVGYSDGGNHFQANFGQRFLAAAVAKYGYQRVGPIVTTTEELPRLARSL